VFVGNPSLVLRLDVNHRFDYVLDEEAMLPEKDKTIFSIKPLSILQNITCKDLVSGDGDENESSIKIGSYHLQLLRYGLVGWRNFCYEDNNSPIEFSEKNFSALPQEAREELSHAIADISNIDDDMRSKIRLAIRWTEYQAKSHTAAQWSCETCSSTQMKVRNCDGTSPRTCRRCRKQTHEKTCPKCGIATTPHFSLKLTNKPVKQAVEGVDIVTRCPIRLLDSKIIAVMNAVAFINDAKSLPVEGAALEQSNFFFSVKQAILSERNAILDEQDNTPGSKNSGGKPDFSAFQKHRKKK